MKRFEFFTKEDLWSLRQEITLNSLFMGDYQNSFGIEPESANAFFDSYVSYICELAEEDGKYDDRDILDIFADYDNPDNLYSWYMCYDDLSWVDYTLQAQEEQMLDLWFNSLDSDSLKGIFPDLFDDIIHSKNPERCTVNDFIDEADEEWDKYTIDQKKDVYNFFKTDD